MTETFAVTAKKVSGEVYARGGLMQKIKAMMELKDQVFSSLPQRLTICGRLYCI